ncbi:acyltransferase [Flavobacterium saccharophilum]|uniref:Acetyltransferase (Isoleucine patch superfamily) n=1 Tax=Flavobacterium saccharophilum TaxID=29534 RepID=A0A1M7GTF9_9FLAO|nr:acyltransferase [Flavobacterium saccharophilum]SHM19485.1 Acetyltransferase (isoleucine patch superfamily) [Flavobacterium saccharophilum]
MNYLKKRLSRYTKSLHYIIYAFYFPRDIIFCLYKLGYWNKTWRFRSLPLIQKHNSAKIVIGKDFIACSNPKYNSIGVFQKVILKALSPQGIITIGDNVGVSGATISGRNITIGNNVLIGSGVLITDGDAHPIHPYLRHKSEYIKFAPITIEDDVFIGARAIILKGVTIGKGSVIGAGSVVATNIPSMSIFAGNPAKLISKIKDVSFYE